MVDSVTILIVASPGRLRDGLKVLLRSYCYTPVIWPIGDAENLCLTFVKYMPKLVVFDAGFADKELWQLLTRLKSEFPHLPSLVVVHSQQQEMRAAGALTDSILHAGYSTEQLVEEINHLIPR